jgi:hypothetical protein
LSKKIIEKIFTVACNFQMVLRNLISSPNPFSMNKSKALMTFGSMSNPQLLAQTRTTHTCLTGNATFPNPDPTLDALGATADQFADVMVEAASGDKVSVQKLRALRQVLIAMMRKITAYVNYISDGDRSKQASTGLPLSAAIYQE